MTVVAPSVRTVDGEEIVSRMVVMVELSAVASQRAVVVPCSVKLRQLKFKEVEVEPIFQLQRRHAFDKAVVRRDDVVHLLLFDRSGLMCLWRCV
jgi:hypothetical protein|mmetsp:Transcript_3379/g.7458  ORF Transcript_3379/g.7458 Transcript_3379/m.7458 type:complete len:94 (+) Transcript_3379:786-1067(+)